MNLDEAYDYLDALKKQDMLLSGHQTLKTVAQKFVDTQEAFGTSGLNGTAGLNFS